jgi:hypothetical protein
MSLIAQQVCTEDFTLRFCGKLNLIFPLVCIMILVKLYLIRNSHLAAALNTSVLQNGNSFLHTYNKIFKLCYVLS